MSFSPKAASSYITGNRIYQKQYFPTEGHAYVGPMEEGFFKDFYHIWAWRRFWSCIQIHLYGIMFSKPKRVSLKYEFN